MLLRISKCLNREYAPCRRYAPPEVSVRAEFVAKVWAFAAGAEAEAREAAAEGGTRAAAGNKTGARVLVCMFSWAAP